MQSFKLGCRTMGDGVIVSAVFMTTGLAMLGAGKLLVPALFHMDMVVQGLGVLLLLFVPFILVTTFLRSAARGDATDGPGIGGRPASGSGA